MDIVTLSQLGEGKTLEYKRNADSLPTILKSVIAFANTAGGILLIGIEDDGEIVGLEHADKVEEQLANSIANRIKPQLFPDFNITQVDGKAILSIQIEHGHGPYYLSDKGMEKSVYIRLGNSNHLASLETIEELKRLNHYASFDSMPCDHVTEADLDMSRIEAIFAKHKRSIDTEKLMSLGLLVKKGKQLVATNGGVILFGLPHVREKFFPYAEVRCARFQGTSRAEFIDRLNISGGILSAITEVPKFIRRNTKMAGKFGGGMERQDIPEYPIDGVREALINALAHANYEVSGSRIFVAIYDDKLEIQNPGIMLPGMSIEQFKAGVSRIRNPVIARTFGELQLIEEWGSGYKRIKEACESGGYPVPTWEEFGSALRVTFYPYPSAGLVSELSAETGTKLAPSRHQAIDLDKDSIKLLAFCREDRPLQAMLEHMHWLDKTKFRRRFVAPLIKQGFLKMTVPEKPNSPNQRYVITEAGITLLRAIGKSE